MSANDDQVVDVDERRETERAAERDPGGHLPRRAVGVEGLDDGLDELEKC